MVCKGFVIEQEKKQQKSRTYPLKLSVPTNILVSKIPLMKNNKEKSLWYRVRNKVTDSETWEALVKLGEGASQGCTKLEAAWSAAKP